MMQKIMGLLPLVLLSAAAVSPVQANWFHTPGSSYSMNVGSAPNPTVQDLRASQLVQGRVGLNIWLTEDGSVSSIEIEQSSGFPRLDDAAVRYVKSNWRYNPDSGPMPTNVHTDAVFTLK